MNWKEHSDRKRVKILLAMGFIPTWIFQYLFSTWLLVTALEGIFIKFDNAGIEGNIMILVLYILAMIANGLSVFTLGEPNLLGILRANDQNEVED